MSRPSTALRRGTRPVVVLVTALSTLAATAFAYAEGIDVSNWQGSISWSKVRSDGVTFAFMKATEGSTYADPTLKTNWAGAKAHGIYRSAYHFARPSVGSAADQARFFVSRAGTFGGKGDLPPVLDLEATGGLGPSALRTWVRTWLRTTEGLTGRTPILYFSSYFWIDYMGNSKAFTRYPLWIANYTHGSPLVPGGWRSWTFWQRTSSGTVSGIAGNVDMNRFNGSSAQLARLANTSGGSSKPPPSGPTVPTGKPTALSLAPGTTTPAIEKRVLFTGLLKGTKMSTPLPQRPLSLWSRNEGSSTWTKVAAATTDTAGLYRFRARVHRTGDYQMRFAGGPTYAASVSPVVRLTTPARTALTISLSKDKTTVRSGQPLTLSGKVIAGTTGVGGRTVGFFKRMPGGSRWVYVGQSTSVAPTGSYSLVVHPKIARVWKAVFSGGHRFLPSTSEYLTIRPR